MASNLQNGNEMEQKIFESLQKKGLNTEKDAMNLEM